MKNNVILWASAYFCLSQLCYAQQTEFQTVSESERHTKLLSNASTGNPSSFRLNYEDGEKNTYAYTENGCRIIGLLYSPKRQALAKPKKNPMADMPLIEEYKSIKGRHTTTFKKVKAPKKKREASKPKSSENSQAAFLDPAVLAPPGSDSTKPIRPLSLQAKVYGKRLSILTWQSKGQDYKVAVRANLLPLASFSAFESPNTAYLFFYHPEDLRDSASGQRNKPQIPKWNKGKGVQAILLEGDYNKEAMEPVEALLEIFETHKKDLRKIYRAYEKRRKKQERLARRPKPTTPEETQSEIFYYIPE